MSERLLIALVALLAGCHAPPPPVADGPVWVFEPATTAPPIDDALAGARLLDGLGAAGRARLVDDLGTLATRLEARHHPLVIDFAGDDLRGDAEAMLRRWHPARTAARVLGRAAWSAPGGAVRVADRCPPGGRCLPLDAPRAALPIAAWPIAHARRLRFADPAAAARAAEALRARLGEPGTALALVFADEPPAAPEAALARHTRRILRRAPRDAARRLAAQLAAPRRDARPPWWPRPAEVFVVPRLARLADPAAIDAEIAAALTPAG